MTRADRQRGASQIAYGWISEPRTDVAANANPEPADMAPAKPPAESADTAAAKASPEPVEWLPPNPPPNSADMAAAKASPEPADMAAAKPPAKSADMNTPKPTPTHATPEPTPSVTASSPAPRRRHVRRPSGQCNRNGKDCELVQQRSRRASLRHRARRGFELGLCRVQSFGIRRFPREPLFQFVANARVVSAGPVAPSSAIPSIFFETKMQPEVGASLRRFRMTSLKREFGGPYCQEKRSRCSMWDLWALRSSLMRAKSLRNQAVLEMGDSP